MMDNHDITRRKARRFTAWAVMSCAGLLAGVGLLHAGQAQRLANNAADAEQAQVAAKIGHTLDACKEVSP